MTKATNLQELLNVHIFQTSDISAEKAKRKCVFAKTKKITSDRVAPTVMKRLRVCDTRGVDGKRPLRPVILVGQSLNKDLEILSRLNIDVFEETRIFTTIDTHEIAQHLFKSHTNSSTTNRKLKLSLFGTLSALGCHAEYTEFHNAGNDAVYTLYLMLLLGIKKGMASIAKLEVEQARRVELLKQVVFKYFLL